MAEFAYNNAKNTNTGQIFFKLNYAYHPRVSFGKNSDLHFRSKLAKKLSVELRNLIIICRENLCYAQNL